MGRKRDLKNVHAKRPPLFNPNDPEDLNEWGEELEQMTSRRRVHNERHHPGKTDKSAVLHTSFVHSSVYVMEIT